MVGQRLTLGAVSLCTGHQSQPIWAERKQSQGGEHTTQKAPRAAAEDHSAPFEKVQQDNGLVTSTCFQATLQHTPTWSPSVVSEFHSTGWLTGPNTLVWLARVVVMWLR
jgi:hypothetical protein